MQIVAFNSSPRDDQTSKTELILQKFLEGARRAGASTETIYLRKHRVEHCLGCFACWLKTPGRCVQPDDMTNELIDRYLEADLAVLASPIYFGNMNARMKAFIDRTLPIYDPTKIDVAQIAEMDSIIPLRFGRHPRIVALGVCGFADPDSFRLLSLHMQTIFRSYLVAEIYRNSSEFLDIPQFQPQVQEVLGAVVQAGEEMVRQGKVGEATTATLTQDLAPAEALFSLMQQYWQQELSKI